MSWTPRSASPMRDPGAPPCTRVRYPAPPRQGHLVNAGLSASCLWAPCHPSAVDLRDLFEFYRVRERLLEPFALSCVAGLGDKDVARQFQPQKGKTQEAYRSPREAGVVGVDSGGALDARARPFARGHPQQAD